MTTEHDAERPWWPTALFTVPAIVLVGLAMGWVSNSGMDNGWYAMLAKPSFQPPGWLFGVMWTTLYTLMGLAVALVWNGPPTPARNVALTLFLVQLILNYCWSPVFFGSQMIDAALLLLVAILVLAAATAIAFGRIRPIAGWLLVPYLLWLCLATALNYETGRLNPGADAAPLGITGA